MARIFRGFDLLRIIAASGVVFSHAFLLAEGAEGGEPFKAATGTILGFYGVMVFFVLSGFLITDSALRAPSIRHFAIRRARRILPLFIGSTLFITLVICPFYTQGTAREFLFSSETWISVFKTLTFQERSLWFGDAISFYPSVGDNMRYVTPIANGVIWTIRLEVTCYALTALLMAMRLLRPRVILVLFVAAAWFVFAYNLEVTDYLRGLAYLAPSFITGMLMRTFLYDSKIRGDIAFLSFAVLAVLALRSLEWNANAAVVFPMLIALPLLWVGQQDGPFLRQLSGLGDPSYGIYLWGWPIQQVLRSFVGPNMDGYVFAALSLLVVVPVGYLSWHMIEKRFVIRRHPRKIVRGDAAGETPETVAPQRVGTGVSPR